MSKDRKRPDYLRAIEQDPRVASVAPPMATQGAGPGPAPDYLTAKQRAIWDELSARYGDRLDESDATLFAKLVNAESLYRGAQVEVERLGVLIKSPSNYPIQNPYLAVVNKQHAFIVRTLSELGLTPLARGRVKPSKKASNARANPFSNLRTLED
jgi:P27 family predicted phage terminase small subunit